MKGLWLAAVALCVLIGGSELFFTLAALPAAKLAALALVAAGVLVLAYSLGERRHNGWNGLALFVFTVYLVGTAFRFPGIVKDRAPGELGGIAAFVLKVDGALIFSAAAAAGLAYGFRRLRVNSSARRSSRASS
jgi:membrane-associated phospholipid phosphatase